MKLHVVYGSSEMFTTVADAKAMEFAMKQIKRIQGTDQEMQVNIASYSVVLAFRILVKEKIISKNEIQFYEAKHPIHSDVVVDISTFDYPILIDDNGTLSREPDFTNVYSDLYLRLI